MGLGYRLVVVIAGWFWAFREFILFSRFWFWVRNLVGGWVCVRVRGVYRKC